MKTTYAVETRRVRPVPSTTVQVECVCARCDRPLKVGWVVSIEQSKLVHRRGDERCTPTVSGRARRV